MKQFLFFANSASDAAMIATDNISDIEITAASGSAKVSINYTTNVGNGDGSILLDTSDSPAAVREIAAPTPPRPRGGAPPLHAVVTVTSIEIN